MIKLSKFNTTITGRPMSTHFVIFVTRVKNIKPAMMIIEVGVTVNHNLLIILIELKFIDFLVIIYLSYNRATVVFFLFANYL